MSAHAAGYAALLRRQAPPVVALPPADPVIDGANAGLRRTIGETWERRAHEELKASMAFAVLSRELLEVGAPPEAIARVARGVSDEVRHAEILRALASRYLGADVAWPPAVHADPAPLGANPRVTVSLHTVTMCCVSETVASVFIEASHAAATSPSVRATLGLILADEVEHGRAGWVFLASVRDERDVMAAVQREAAAIVRRVADRWFDFSEITLPDGAPEHGLLSNDDSRRSVITALRDVVLPGFEQLGLDVRAAAAVVEELA